jgi:hypothetical protein
VQAAGAIAVTSIVDPERLTLGTAQRVIILREWLRRHADDIDEIAKLARLPQLEKNPVYPISA